MEALCATEGVYVVKGPMCKWNLQPPVRAGPDDGVPEYHKKETGWVTNSRRLADRLEGICSNADGSRPWHRHVHLVNGLGHHARVYTPELVQAILEEIRDELLEMGELSLGSVQQSGPVPEEPVMPEGPWEAYWDDVNGGYLEPNLVKEARAT